MIEFPSIKLTQDQVIAISTALVTIIASVAVALMPAARRRFGGGMRWALLRSGYVDVRYRRWFIRHHRTIEHAYSDRREKLDLDETYIPLTMVESAPKAQPAAEPGERIATSTVPAPGNIVATQVMATQRTHSLIIVGDAGTGKSTLLKAYGVGILWKRGKRTATELKDIRRTKEVPFYISLKRFARDVDHVRTLHRYLISEVLSERTCLGDYATMYFERLLRRQRCLILLDGIDEVAGDKYTTVRDEIHRFLAQYGGPGAGRARIILTCRLQNFMRVKHDWIPSFSSNAYALAPFRDAEILRYAQKLRKRFVGKHTPEEFFRAVMASETKDLHRIPLILAMSVGLYARREDYEIPPSISLLYREVIEDLVAGGRGEPFGKTSKFGVNDKLIFLRTLALDCAKGAARFEDFPKRAIFDCARKLASTLDQVDDDSVADFVDEFLRRPDILVRQSDDGMYGFSHRTIFEFLAAEQLSQDPSAGTAFLVGRARDPHWRQTCLFFASILRSQSHADQFVKGLAKDNLELSGYCLGSAVVSFRSAKPILESLARNALCENGGGTFLAALLRATRSPKPDVQKHATKLATEALLRMISDNQQFRVSGDVHAALNVLESLSGSALPRLGILAAKIAAQLPDDPRLVEHLWRCLGTLRAGRDGDEYRDIVSRLLSLASEADCLRILQEQPRYEWQVLSKEAREKAFPFRKGADLSSNLVTLIAWADEMKVAPARSLFFKLKAQHPVRFMRAERDHRWTFQVPFRHLPKMVAYGSPGVAIIVLAGYWTSARERYLLGARAITSEVGNVGYVHLITPSILLLVLAVVLHAIPPFELNEESNALGCFSNLVFPPIYAAALLPFSGGSFATYLAVSVVGSYLLSILPHTALAAMASDFHLPPLNKCLVMYTDRSCRLWITGDGASAS